jgi:hypothetical protein
VIPVGVAGHVRCQEYFVARDLAALQRLLAASEAHDAAAFGLALGYSQADIEVYREHTKTCILPPGNCTHRRGHGV